MAARTMRIRHQDDVRKKIQSSMIINRLTDYFTGKIDLDVGRVSAGKILLAKVLPDLTSIDGKIDSDVTIKSLDVNWVKPK